MRVDPRRGRGDAGVTGALGHRASVNPRTRTIGPPYHRSLEREREARNWEELAVGDDEATRRVAIAGDPRTERGLPAIKGDDDPDIVILSGRRQQP
jgi:hypothetical protein